LPELRLFGRQPERLQYRRAAQSASTRLAVYTVRHGRALERASIHPEHLLQFGHGVDGLSFAPGQPGMFVVGVLGAAFRREQAVGVAPVHDRAGQRAHGPGPRRAR
jgi:hypothetical protein